MTSDRIEQVAQVAASAMDGYSEGASHIEDYRIIARALAEEGLLAPAPLREEWSTTNEWGDEDYCCGFDARETVEGDGRPIVRRYVTDWETP